MGKCLAQEKQRTIKKEFEARVKAAKENAAELKRVKREQARIERRFVRQMAEEASAAARQAEHAKLMEQHAKFKKERDDLVAHIKAQMLAKKLGDKGQLAQIDQGIASESTVGHYSLYLWHRPGDCCHCGYFLGALTWMILYGWVSSCGFNKLLISLWFCTKNLLIGGSNEVFFRLFARFPDVCLWSHCSP